MVGWPGSSAPTAAPNDTSSAVEQRGYDPRYDSHGYGHRKKRKSFFEELFD
jgi:Zn-finger nucleic acid-binding protein